VRVKKWWGGGELYEEEGGTKGEGWWNADVRNEEVGREI